MTIIDQPFLGREAPQGSVNIQIPINGEALLLPSLTDPSAILVIYEMIVSVHCNQPDTYANATIYNGIPPSIGGAGQMICTVSATVPILSVASTVDYQSFNTEVKFYLNPFEDLWLQVGTSADGGDSNGSGFISYGIFSDFGIP